MIGPGKYDKQLTEALKQCGATTGLLIVVDGKQGPSFCGIITADMFGKIPSVLRDMADQIERDQK